MREKEQKSPLLIDDGCKVSLGRREVELSQPYKNCIDRKEEVDWI